ncbi:MAG: sialidase family protein [Tepidisphaeraceae bacterium]
MNSTRFVAAAVVFLSLSLAASAQVTPAGGDNDAQIAQLKAQIAALEAAKTQTASGPSAAAQAPDNSPLRPIEQSDLVVKDSSGAPMVADKTGKGIDGIKLSQHDTLIASPSIAVAPDGTIHVAFMEKHRTTYADAIYHRSSSDGGKTWTEAKNLSEDMPGIDVGRCQVLVDSQNRVYVIWRSALATNWMITPDPAGGATNLWFRELEGGNWSSIKPIGVTCDQATQLNAVFCFFAAIDAAGHAQVLWNVMPDKWHPETLLRNGHSNGVGNGLVFQSTLDGATASDPREVFLPVVTPAANAWGSPSCDGLDTMNGYVDAAGAAHFVALAAMPMYGLPQHPAHYELIENGKAGQSIQLPDLSFHAARDIPTLLVDAKGKQHVIALFLAGEHPNIRDYLLGSDAEPAVIRAAVGLNGTIAGFQAYQGPGGRMVVIMQMNDTGAEGSAENYVSISTGDGKWSPAVNVTDNAGRNTYVSRDTSAESQVALQTGADPGPGAAAFDHDGHLLLLAVKDEFSIVHSVAFGVEIAGGGGSKTPTLRFLRF